MADQKQSKKVEVEVITDTHSHAGKRCVKGDKITLTEAQADRLRKDGVVR